MIICRREIMKCVFFYLFKKIGENNFYLFYKTIIYFTLFLKIGN